MSVIGTCRLCLGSGKPLRVSHIVPKWAYKRIRGSGGNPNPVYFTDERAIQTSEQVTDELLCDDCEQRLGIYDAYASNVACRADGSVAIFDRVLRLGEAAPDTFAEAAPVNLDLDRLLRFGTSVIWRAHVSREVPKCILGDRYGEEFRRFLLGLSAFPVNAVCLLILIDDADDDETPIHRLITMPVSSRCDRYHTHRLLVCGLHFELIVGSGIPEIYRPYCLARGNPHRLLISASDLAIDWIGPMVKGAKKLGALARSRKAAKPEIAGGTESKET